MSWVRNRIDRLRYLWRAALEENQDPRRFALAVAVGVTISASPVPPVLGMRSAVAVAGAWLTRCSKLTAFLSVHLLGALFIPITIFSVRLGSYLLQRPSPTWGTTTAERLEAAKRALLAWWVGGLLFAPLVGVVAYWIAFAIAKRYRARKERQRQQSETSSVDAGSGS